MRSNPFLWLLAASLVCGCSIPSEPASEELFVAVPRGLPSSLGPEVRAALTDYIQQAPSGTPLTFFLADNQERLASVTVPEGSRAYRKKVIGRSLARVFDRLDPEHTGGSQAVDLLAVPASIRKYRKRQDLPPRVVIIGSTLIEDREQGNSITPRRMPCDACVTDDRSSYGRMPTFPAGTTVSWLTPRADYGNGPDHREQIEHFLRYLLHEKQGPLLRLSPEASIVFGSRESQWDDTQVRPRDNCSGDKESPELAFTPAEPDGLGRPRIIHVEPNRSLRAWSPEVRRLAGDKRRVLFVIDISGSVVRDADGNDQSHIFKAIVADVCQKIGSMEFERFSVCGFGGWANGRPRLSRFPSSLFAELTWSDGSEDNRLRGIEFVQKLKPGGGTPTRIAIEQALGLEGPVTCLLYTDGVPTIGVSGQSGALESARLLATAGVTINSVGVGALSAENEEFDWTGGEFLSRLAELTRGKYFVLRPQL